MSDVIIEEMDVAPSVVETIVSMAITDVEGVAQLGSDPSVGLFSALSGRPSTSGVEVCINEERKLCITVHIDVWYGYALPDLADEIRQLVMDAVSTQIGMEVATIDVCIEGVHFSAEQAKK